MIKVKNLTKRFGGRTAVDDVSFEVRSGEIVGFLGPNGAGKTTTMRILSCFLPASGGTVAVAGKDVFTHSMEVRKCVGYMPENVPLYRDMRVGEYLSYRARLKGVTGRQVRQRVDAVASTCGLYDARHRIIGQLSKGYQQRVGLADALVHDPDVLILDEPSIGLDPNQIRHIRTLIKSLAHRYTVLLSSHILHEVEMICERVLIINEGRIVASDTPDNLVGLMKGNLQVVIEVKADLDAAKQKLMEMDGVARVSGSYIGQWCRLSCECQKDADVRDRIARAIVEQGWPLRELSAQRRNLEDVFVAITTEEGGSK